MPKKVSSKNTRIAKPLRSNPKTNSISSKSKHSTQNGPNSTSSVFILAVFSVGILSSFLFYYSQAVFVERPVIDYFSVWLSDLSGILFNRMEEDASKDLHVGMQTIGFTPSGDLQKDVNESLTRLDIYYGKFKSGSLVYQICGNLSSSDECVYKVYSTFPYNLTVASDSVTLPNLALSFSRQHITRADETFSNVFLAGGMFLFEVMEVVRDRSDLSSVENCLNTSVKLNSSEKIALANACSNNFFQSIDGNATRIMQGIVSPSFFAPTPCSQYLPLLQAKKIEAKLYLQLQSSQNPLITRRNAYYVAAIDRCVSELQAQEIQPCYAPLSASLTEKSIRSVLKTNVILISCLRGELTK